MKNKTYLNYKLKKPIFSVDVEEWFHLLELSSVKPIKNWDDYENRAQLTIPRILSILKKNNSTGTFFFLGWLAEKSPSLVEMVLKEGHEIGSHGYSHELIKNQTSIEFANDVKKSINILEEIVGTKIKGYRAPGFSITPYTVWAFDILINQGLEYDASIFPGKRYHGGFTKMPRVPFKINTENGSILEFPNSVLKFGSSSFSVFGGGYFRITPVEIIKHFSSLLLKNENYVSLYLHPRDIDSKQPKLSMKKARSFRTYVNLSSTESKLNEFLTHMPSCSINEYIMKTRELSTVHPLTYNLPQILSER